VAPQPDSRSQSIIKRLSIKPAIVERQQKSYKQLERDFEDVEIQIDAEEGRK